MRKFNTKLITTVSAITLSAFFAAGCVGNDATPESKWKTGSDIGGGVTYIMDGDKTGPYYVNSDAHKMSISNGRVPTAAELKAWNVDLQPRGIGSPNGQGIPVGSGSVEEGEELYDAKCLSCHGDFGAGYGTYPALGNGNAYELNKTLTNNRYLDPEADGPTRVFGSYWPQLTTMFWYIRDAMPHPKSKTLTTDEVYALTAYMLYINEIEVNGELVEEEFVLSNENFLDVRMPNEDGFEPNIAGANSLPGVRAYFNNPANYGAQKVKYEERCMTDCQDESAKVVKIQNGGIQSFTPPLSVVRDLPKVKKAGIDVLEVYKNNCSSCHDGMLSVGSDDWANYTTKGIDKVYENAISGTDAGMPAMGGVSMSKENFKTLVDYLITGKIK